MDALFEEAIERLNKLGGPAFVQKMIDLFLEFGAAKTRETALAVRTGDFEAAGKAAHALKSSAANVGALRVQELAADLEAQARTGERDSLTGLATRLEARFAEVQPLLKAARERFKLE